MGWLDDLVGIFNTADPSDIFGDTLIDPSYVGDLPTVDDYSYVGDLPTADDFYSGGDGGGDETTDYPVSTRGSTSLSDQIRSREADPYTAGTEPFDYNAMADPTASIESAGGGSNWLKDLAGLLKAGSGLAGSLGHPSSALAGLMHPSTGMPNPYSGGGRGELLGGGGLGGGGGAGAGRADISGLSGVPALGAIPTVGDTGAGAISAQNPMAQGQPGYAPSPQQSALASLSAAGGSPFTPLYMPAPTPGNIVVTPQQRVSGLQRLMTALGGG
jgi:hypothetical protein